MSSTSLCSSYKFVPPTLATGLLVSAVAFIATSGPLSGLVHVIIGLSCLLTPMSCGIAFVYCAGTTRQQKTLKAVSRIHSFVGVISVLFWLIGLSGIVPPLAAVIAPQILYVLAAIVTAVYVYKPVGINQRCE